MAFAAVLPYLTSVPVVCLYLYGIVTVANDGRYKYSLAYAVMNTVFMTAIGVTSQIGILVVLFKHRLLMNSQVLPLNSTTVSVFACATRFLFPQLSLADNPRATKVDSNERRYGRNATEHKESRAAGEVRCRNVLCFMRRCW